MSTDELLNELIDRWEDRRRTNPAITIREICADHPDLIEPLAGRIETLRRMDALLDQIGAVDEDSGRGAAEGGSPSGEGPVGRTFDEYELLEEIARGGMGVVYRARERSPNRLVALKMIRPDRFARPSDKVRFLVEAETAANLAHPNIIPIYKVGECDGQLYFSMKFFEDGSLAGRIARAPHAEREAASLVRTIALAIHAAHRYGILHRDLKPSNILLDAEGGPHVTDFGLAKRIGDDAGATLTGDILGTPCYMAPEQVAGKSKSFTIATDVYGLGAILYELLTRRKPFEGASVAECLARVQHKEPRRPRSINSRISRDLESICLKCLEKDQSRRYRSAEALAEDIDRWLAGKPVQAYPIGLAERSGRWCRRNPLVAGLAGSVLILAMATMIGASAALSRILAEREATAAALKVAEDQRKIAEARATEAEEQRRLAFVSRHSVLYGITEPLKQLADPDLARNPEFAELRHEIIRVALRILDEYAISANEEGWTIDFLIHKGLLLTADGDHPGTWEAYKRAIGLAERLVGRSPSSAGTWDRAGQAHTHLGMDLWDQGRKMEAGPHLRAASEAFRRATALAAPGEYFYFQHAAWFLLFCPEERWRDPKTALELASRLAGSLPDYERDNPTTLAGVRPLLTLGLAHYRLGEWAEARVPIEKSIRLRDGGDAYEGFAIAMTLARLGDREAALSCYQAANRSMRRHRFGDFELHFLHDEAAASLGLGPGGD